jgi:hypothetical protein
LPIEAFKTLFHDHHNDPEIAVVLRFVDWAEVIWEEGALSGVALRHSGVPRGFQLAVDQARQETASDGFRDDRPEVMQHWAEFHSWTQPPILLIDNLLQSNLRYELVVGFTRLGNLLGALDRQDLPGYARHRVWIGHRLQKYGGTQPPTGAGTATSLVHGHVRGGVHPRMRVPAQTYFRLLTTIFSKRRCAVDPAKRTRETS